jgi:hypothetical protein
MSAAHDATILTEQSTPQGVPAMNHWSTVELLAADHRNDLARDVAGSWRIEADATVDAGTRAPARALGSAVARRSRQLIRSVALRSHLAAALHLGR